MNKIHVTLNEKNFKRLSKNISKNLKNKGYDINKSTIDEVLSKSCGFNNLHQAQLDDYKTDKFSPVGFSDFFQPNNEFKNNYCDDFSNLTHIYNFYKKNKSELDPLFIFNSTKYSNNVNKEIIDFINEATNVLYSKTLDVSSLIYQDLYQRLINELEYGVRFDFSEWFIFVNKLFRTEINFSRIGNYSNVYFFMKEKNNRIFNYFINKSSFLYECNLLNELYLLEVEDIMNITLDNHHIAEHYISESFKSLKHSSIVQKKIIISKLEKFLININDRSCNFPRLINVDLSLFDFSLDFILSFKENDDFYCLFNIIFLLLNNEKLSVINFNKDTYNHLIDEITKNYSYLLSIDSVNSFINTIRKI